MRKFVKKILVALPTLSAPHHYLCYDCNPILNGIFVTIKAMDLNKDLILCDVRVDGIISIELSTLKKDLSHK